ncbi:RidA family protein [Chloroflexota bacterium]
MNKQIIRTDKAPLPKAPYSQAIIYDNLLFVSGQGPVDPNTQEIVYGTIEEEIRLTLSDLKAIIEAAGFSMDNVLKVTVILTDIRDFAKVSEVYKEFFNVDPPARTCFEASNLPFNIKCEVEAIVGK